MWQRALSSAGGGGTSTPQALAYVNSYVIYNSDGWKSTGIKATDARCLFWNGYALFENGTLISSNFASTSTYTISARVNSSTGNIELHLNRTDQFNYLGGSLFICS